jgi:hypothetical protein
VLGNGDVLSNCFSDGTFSEEDAVFISHARDDLRRLVDEVFSLRKQVKDLRFCIKALNQPTDVEYTEDNARCDEAGEVRINKPNGEVVSYRVYEWFDNISALIEAFSVETHPTMKITKSSAPKNYPYTKW